MLYTNLFPNGPFWDAARLRATPAFKYLGNILWNKRDNQTANFFNNLVDANYKPLASFDDLYGPVNTGQDNETAIVRWDYLSPDDVPSNDSTPAPQQPFAAKDIIVVTDGVCASTCTVFVGLMARQAGVRTLALGGRPLKAPMQAMGGVKGSREIGWSLVTQQVSAALQGHNGSEGQQLLMLPSPAPSTAAASAG